MGHARLRQRSGLSSPYTPAPAPRLTVHVLAGPFTANRADGRRAAADVRSRRSVGVHTETRVRRAQARRARRRGTLRPSAFGGRAAARG